jgi:hypothetical protein
MQVEMSKDAEAQRQVCVNLVGEAISRNNKYIDKLYLLPCCCLRLLAGWKVPQDTL